MFDWNDLKYFLAVARNGSTLAAARSLRLSQSTVHRRLEELERKLGHPLVKRHPTGYRLTELGVEIRDSAERVEIVMNDKVVDLAKGHADVAIRTVLSHDNALIGRKIADSPWSLYASRAYVKSHGGIVRPEDIDRHAVVIFGGEMRDHHSVGWIRSVAPNARIAARANNLPALLMAVKSGAGISPMPLIVGGSEPNLVRLLPPAPALATPFYLMMHGDMKKTPRVRAFFDFVVAELPALRPWLSGEIARPATRKSPRKRKR